MSAQPAQAAISRRPLGNTGVDVSILCLGGYHLGNFAREEDATRLVHEALEAGLDFFDNAWEYHEGLSEVRLGKALVGRRDRAFVMTKVCTHGRGRAGGHGAARGVAAAAADRLPRPVADPRVRLPGRAGQALRRPTARWRR